MHLEELTKIPGLSYRIPGSYFNLVNFTPVINYIHNISIDKISEFSPELKFNNSLHKKYIFHYFIHYTCEVLKAHNKKNKPVIYFDVDVDLNTNLEKVEKTELESFIEEFGEDMPEDWEIISEKEAEDEAEDFDFQTELNSDYYEFASTG